MLFALKQKFFSLKSWVFSRESHTKAREIHLNNQDGNKNTKHNKRKPQRKCLNFLCLPHAVVVVTEQREPRRKVSAITGSCKKLYLIYSRKSMLCFYFAWTFLIPSKQEQVLNTQFPLFTLVNGKNEKETCAAGKSFSAVNISREFVKRNLNLCLLFFPCFIRSLSHGEKKQIKHNSAFQTT